MACQITYNNDNQIIRVNTPSGEESTLFNQIAKIPQINTLEQSLTAYQNVYKDGYKGETPLTFISEKGNEFTTYKDALLDSDGGNIEVKSGDISLLTISANTNKNTKEGLTNYLIKENIISDERVIDQGKSFLKAEGNSLIRQIINENVTKDLRSNTIVHKDGRIEFTDDQVKKNNFVADSIRKTFSRVYGTKQGKLSEKVLKNRLLDFLKEIGVSITNIENYSKRYNVDVSANALADISNRIVAFREGKISVEALTEETAHFIVEGWDVQEINDLVRDIHKTQSYGEHSENYREVYSKENPSMSESAIEYLVRKEVLGKELAKALQNKFTSETTPQNILQRMYNAMLNFFDKIVLKDNYRQKLEDLTTKVEDALLTNNLSNYLNTSNFDNKKFKLYSLNKSANPQHNLIKALQEQEKVLIKLGRGSAEQLHKLQGYLEKTLEETSVRDLISLARRQTSYINEAIKSANSRGAILSNEENIVFQNLKNVINPALSLLKTSIEKNKNYSSEVIDIKGIQEEINDAVGALHQSETTILSDIVESILQRDGREDDNELRQELLNAFTSAKKDTNSLYSYFGQITHAQDPLLNMLGSVIGDLYQDTAEEFQDVTKDFQNELRKLGFKEQDLSKLVQKDGYITSKWDFAEFKEFTRYAKAQAYKDNLQAIIDDLKSENKSAKEHEEYLGLTDEQFLAKFKELPLISNFELFQKVKTEAQKIVNTGSETFLADKYIKEQEKRLAGYNEATKTVLRNLSQMRGQVRRQMKKSKNGIPVLTRQNKIDLDIIASERAKHLNIYDSFGKLHTGIILESLPFENSVKISENEYIGLDYSLATKEAIIAFELNKYNRNFIDQIKEKQGQTTEGLSESWRKDLQDMENDPEMTREDIISWFNLNTSLGFSNKFFEDNEYVDIFENYLEDEIIGDKIKEYKNLLKQRRNLLKQYKDSKNSVNTNVDLMPEGVRQQIRQLSESIDVKSSQIFMYIKGKGGEIQERRASVNANEAFFGRMGDLNLQTTEEKLDFAQQNMTSANREKVSSLLRALETDSLNDKMKNLLEPYGESREGILKYAQTRLLPYYSSYAPIDLQDFYRKVRTTNEPLSKLVAELEKSEDVRMSVSYDYMDNSESNDMLNPLRDVNFKGGISQPSLIKRPKVFGKEFNFNNKKWDKIKNDSKLVSLHDLIVNYQSQSLKDADHEQGNAYLMPQVPKSIINNIETSLKGGVKNVLKEKLESIKSYRVGEIDSGERDEQGNTLYHSNIRVIPKYYVHPLENAENVSDDLFYSMTLMRQQAILRKNRVKNYNKVSALRDAISDSSRYSGIGKSAEATNTFKMAQSYIDNAIFGVEDVTRARVSIPILGEVDATKILKYIHRWKQNLSLSFNPIVPITSWMTAYTGLVGERLIGQYLDQDSMNKAFRKTATENMNSKGDFLEVYSKSEASVILEHLGLINLTEQFKNSKYGKVTRAIGDTAYGLHRMADFPIKSNVMYSLMYGHRIYNGKLVDKNAFNRLTNGAGINKKDADLQWKELIPLYDFVEIKDGKFNYKESLYKQLNTTPEEFKNIEKGVISKGKALAQRVDGSIREEERTFAQRHFALRYTMTHKGWLALAVSNRFKGRHYNMQTSQWEEGSYVSAGKVVSRIIENLYKGDFRNIAKIWENSSQEERVNLQRILKEIGVLGAIYGLGLVFAGMADEDDDSMAKQMMAYLFERVTNETISSQAGIVKELYSSVQEPIVGINQLTELPKAYKVFTGGDDIVQRGRYAGLTERERWIIKNFVGAKPIYDLWDASSLKSQRDSYNFFSNDTNSYNIWSWLFPKEEFLEEN